jgi:hypothetical protein
MRIKCLINSRADEPLIQSGHINLFTVRHEPGRVCHVMNGHRGPVSALSLGHDEKGYFSAGWDGEAIVSHVCALSEAFSSPGHSNGISTQVNV